MTLSINRAVRIVAFGGLGVWLAVDGWKHQQWMPVIFGLFLIAFAVLVPG
jgi:hypothetical protein